ncbi:MAG: ATP-binding protein [Deltaproteobacteria bacterium]|nr:MAG: ATP-binding protein [Deltaproteobacteria bacterium]
MKVLICGKGGSGKSTLSVLIARTMKERGYRVLLVDADESNFGLYRLMGVTPPMTLMDYLGGKKGFKQKLNAPLHAHGAEGILPGKLRIDEIPKTCVARADGIRLLVIGKILDFGEGCACPMGVLSKMVLSRIEEDADEIVIVDTEAGVEHFGRGVDQACDMVIGIVDPTFESFMTAEKISEMAEKAGAALFFVLNKVEETVASVMDAHIDTKRVIGRIPRDPDIFMAGLSGKTLATGVGGMERIARTIEGFAGG